MLWQRFSGQLSYAVEPEYGPLVTVRREEDVDLVRLGFPGDLASDLDYQWNAQPHRPTGPRALDSATADAPGVPLVLAPLLVVVAVGHVPVFVLAPILRGH